MNATIMPNYRAVAYETNPNDPGEEGVEYAPVGYIDFEDEDGPMLVGIFFLLQIFFLWNAYQCWRAGSIGLDMVNDAYSIVTAKSGRLDKTAEVPLESIPLAGTGRAPHYSRKFRGICGGLVSTLLTIALLTIAHEYLRAEYMDKALTSVYEGHGYLEWKAEYTKNGP